MTYPLRPPAFRFLTPSGRFEVNREICLSISGHHEETWQPAWGIRTALVAIRSFMDTDAKGQLGGLECDRATRQKMAKQSGGWTCPTCRKGNSVIMSLLEDATGTGAAIEPEKVPEELRLAYREDLSGTGGSSSTSGTAPSSSENAQPAVPAPATQSRRIPRQAQQRRNADTRLDQAIYALAALLIFLIARKLLGLIQ
jgi:ubiquitin-conjugating enzyme E2 J1